MKSTSCSEVDGVVFNDESELFEVYVKGVLRGLATDGADAQRIYAEVSK